MDLIKRLTWQSTITLSLLFALLAFVLGQQLTSASVALVYFEGDGSSNSQVDLEWETGSEVDTVGFAIERSTNETSGFETIPVQSNGSETSFVPSVGAAAFGDVYSVVDTNVLPNTTYYYRLIEYVSSGSSADIGDIEVTLGSAATDPTDTPTNTPTSVPADTSTPTPTNTIEPTATNTLVPTNTLTPTITNTPIPDATFTPTATATLSPSRTPIPSRTPTNTVEPTATLTPTITNTPIPNATFTPTATATATEQPTRTPVPTFTPFPTLTPNPLIPPTETSAATEPPTISIASVTPTAIFGTPTPTGGIVSITDDENDTVEPTRTRRVRRTPIPATPTPEEGTEIVSPTTEILVDVTEEDIETPTPLSQIVLIAPTNTPMAVAEISPTIVIEDNVVVQAELPEISVEEQEQEINDVFADQVTLTVVPTVITADTSTIATPIFPPQNPTAVAQNITRAPTVIQSQPTGGNAVIASADPTRENNGISGGVQFDTNQQSQNTVQANAASQRSKFMLLWLGFIMSFLLFAGTAIASIYLFMRRNH